MPIGFWDGLEGYALITLLSLLVCGLLVHYKNRNTRVFKTRIEDLTHQHQQLRNEYDALSRKYDRLFTGATGNAESQEQRLLKKAQTIVENNLSNSLFGVEELAREIGMSRTNLHRKIKSISGLPPSEFIRNMRLKKASILLLNQSNSVSQVSFSVGFEDHSYFSKAFKKHYGVSPSEYFQREMKTA
jgi:AraC-like DNA-binding protein